jgi:hypothetical protein
VTTDAVRLVALISVSDVARMGEHVMTPSGRSADPFSSPSAISSVVMLRPNRHIPRDQLLAQVKQLEESGDVDYVFLVDQMLGWWPKKFYDPKYIWRGDYNLAVGLAKGEVKAKGPVNKILKLVPLTKPLFPMYREAIAEKDGS